jgi:hypothetical protein
MAYARQTPPLRRDFLSPRPMPAIFPSPLPAGAALESVAQAGAYTDCYRVEVPQVVALPRFVEAFTTSRIFRLERWLIHCLLRRPGSDADARRLASGASDRFSAWAVRQRDERQILLAAGATRSWLMVAPRGDSAGSTLYFGSAVRPRRIAADGTRRMGALFVALLGFHRLYSRVLLAAACRRLASVPDAE